eukprot:CAMPEP_0196782052 /NCGR_PEP_ID=MMETSP1104-20130614/10596_1 /TAXON_ID=33652 /ORGANISM="Cafeteria sp., Strain Caron Lab Isolate" /LENGTH=186 /DNA_ID=CAMNT_0042152283 /DNA_START=3 /DNA_END=563 /DNA_ORIENTATION=+
MNSRYLALAALLSAVAVHAVTPSQVYDDGSRSTVPDDFVSRMVLFGNQESPMTWLTVFDAHDPHYSELQKEYNVGSLLDPVPEGSKPVVVEMRADYRCHNCSDAAGIEFHFAGRTWFASVHGKEGCVNGDECHFWSDWTSRVVDGDEAFEREYVRGKENKLSLSANYEDLIMVRLVNVRIGYKRVE